MSIGFESLLPNVYFERITLDTTAKAEYTETNPHIDTEKEPKFVINVKTGKVETENVSSDLNKKKDNSEHLITKIDLVVREKLDHTSVSSWFNDQDMLKYLKVRILQSSDEDITNNIANGVYTIFNESLYEKRRKVSMQSIFLRDIKKDILDSYDYEHDNDGNRIFNIPFSVEFQLANLNPKHLSYFASAYLDVESMAKDYLMDLPPGNIKVIMGRIASEIVIREVSSNEQSSTGVMSNTINSVSTVQLVSESYVFLTEQDQVWDGPVHIIDGKWMSGIEGDPSTKHLKIQTIINSKIQDFRDRKEIEKLQNDFSVIENQVLGNRNIKILSNDILDIEKKVNYFSNFNMARDSEGQCRFLFGVDFLRLAKEKTIYGNFYRNSNIELLNHIRVKSLKVYRVRISSNLYALKDENGISHFDIDTDMADLIAFSKEKDTGQIQKNEYVISKEDKSGRRIGVIREVGIDINNQIGVRHFTGVDYEMKDVTFGTYKYLIELEIEDKTSEFVEKKVGDLLEAYNLLKNYYDEASFIKNYDVYSNRFKTNYINELENYYSNNVERAPWIFSVSMFLSVLDAIYSGVNVRKFSNSLYLFTHPRTGSPDSILMVLNVIDKLVSQLTNLVGIKMAGSSTKWDRGTRQTSLGANILKSKVPIGTFVVKSYSEGSFDSDIPKKIGYDYLSNGELELESNDDGLKVVSNMKFDERTNLETLKYFKNVNTDINISTDAKIYTVDDKISNSRYSFLTPSSINFGKEVSIPLLQQGKSLYEPSKYEAVLTQVTRFNQARKSPQVTLMPLSRLAVRSVAASQEQTRTNLTQIFSEKSVSVAVVDSGVSVAGSLTPVNSVSSTTETVNSALSTTSRFAPTVGSVEVASTRFAPTVGSVEVASSTLLPIRNIVGSGSLITKEDPKIEEFSKTTLLSKIASTPNVETALIPLISFVNNNIDNKNTSVFNGTITRSNTSNLMESIDLNKSTNIIDKITTAPFETVAGRISIPSVGTETVSGLVRPTVGTETVSGLVRPTVGTEQVSRVIRSIAPSPGIEQVSGLIRTSVGTELAGGLRKLSAGTELAGGLRLSSGTEQAAGITTIKRNFAGEYLKSLPNQLKSLVIDNSNVAGKLVKSWTSVSNIETVGDLKVKPDDSLMFQANYKNIKQIEVLDGYEISIDGIQIKSQRWVKLTEDIFKKSINRNLLCRMVTFQDKLLGIDVSKGLELPYYNEYFILSPEERLQEIASLTPINKQKILSEQMATVDISKSNIGKMFSQTTKMATIDIGKSNIGKTLSQTTSLPVVQRGSNLGSILEVANINPIAPIRVNFQVQVGELNSRFSANVSTVNKLITSTLGSVSRKMEEQKALTETVEISPITGFRVKR